MNSLLDQPHMWQLPTNLDIVEKFSQSLAAQLALPLTILLMANFVLESAKKLLFAPASLKRTTISSAHSALLSPLPA